MNDGLCPEFEFIFRKTFEGLKKQVDGKSLPCANCLRNYCYRKSPTIIYCPNWLGEYQLEFDFKKGKNNAI